MIEHKVITAFKGEDIDALYSLQSEILEVMGVIDKLE